MQTDPLEENADPDSAHPGPLQRKQCFVISPIGEPGGDVRKHADQVFDLITEAMQGLGFEIIRADMIREPGRITDDMVDRIQNADLCVIVLTGCNPNVYYECGRRHETGKPYIHLIAKNESALFDLKDYRQVTYDFSSAASFLQSVRDVRKAVTYFQNMGYARTSGTSLATVADALTRIELRLDKLVLSVPARASGGRVSPVTPGAATVSNPRESFNIAYYGGDFQTCATLLPRLKQLLGLNHEFIKAAAIVATQGFEEGAQELIAFLEADHVQLDLNAMQNAINAMTQYYLLTMREQEGLDKMKPVLDRLLASGTLDASQEALCLNALGVLLSGIRDYENAAQLESRAAELCPLEGSYFYNAAVNYEKLGDSTKSIHCIDHYMTLESSRRKSNHVQFAVEEYVKAARSDDAVKSLVILKEISPERFRYLQSSNEAIRELIAHFSV